MLSSAQFARKLRRHAASIPKQKNEIKKIMAAEVLREVATTTPRDTGQAQANWITSLDAPDRVTTRPGPGSAADSVDRGAPIISKAQPGQSIHITNNLPYITALNNGYSKQAPRNYVKGAVKRVSRIIDKYRIRWDV